jgi:hypothetical protein
MYWKTTQQSTTFGQYRHHFAHYCAALALSSDEMELGSGRSSLYAKVYVKNPTRASVDIHRALGDFSERPSRPSLQQQQQQQAHNINI